LYFSVNNLLTSKCCDGLPAWLVYDEGARKLESASGPAETDIGKLTIQVLGEAGKILEQFDLNVVPPPNLSNVSSAYDSMYSNASALQLTLFSKNDAAGDGGNYLDLDADMESTAGEGTVATRDIEGSYYSSTAR